MEASGYCSLILCLESAVMRDCVLWNIKREQDKMHRKYGAPAVGACQGHILQETILWLSGYQRQTFHFITGA